MATRCPRGQNKPVSSVATRPLVGYMAFNHITNAMALTEGHSPWFKGVQAAIYNTTGREGTLFKDAASALIYIDRTIKGGRREWKRMRTEDGLDPDWRKSSWKWLFRQTWSVVPMFMALPSEHPIKEAR